MVINRTKFDACMPSSFGGVNQKSLEVSCACMCVHMYRENSALYIDIYAIGFEILVHYFYFSKNYLCDFNFSAENEDGLSKLFFLIT